VKYFVAPAEDLVLDDRTRQKLRGSFIELSQGVTHYELAGPKDGEIAVLTGGLTVPLFYWDDLARWMHERGMRTLAFSAYGRGYSDRLTGDYVEAVFVRQLADLLDALGIRSYHLVGTSMGALVAMAFLAERADATTLTLAGPAGLSKPSPTRWLFKSDALAGVVGRRLGRRLLDGHLDHNVRDEGSADVLTRMVRDAFRYEGSMYALFSTLQNFPLTGRSGLFCEVGRIGVPTMLLWGRDDHVTPISNLDTARSLLQPRQCHVIPECGHMAPLERPFEVAEFAASFAAQIGGPDDQT
jgi:pimeloyl-ACP methyl ester carboxylesterase